MVTSPARHAAAVTEHYDTRAPRYDDSEMHRALADAILDFAGLGDVDTVLDVATGTGLVLRAAVARGSDARLTGVDLSPGMLAVAREHLPGADLHQADAATPPVPAGAFDLVTCVTALHLFPRPGDALAAWARALRPAGRIVTATFAPRTRPHPPSVHGVPRRFRVNHEPVATAESLAEIAAGSGLELIRHEHWRHADDVLLLSELAPVPAARTGQRTLSEDDEP